MRTVTYGAACSLDGFIAGQAGAIDWLHFSKDVQDIMKEYWAHVDAVLMGRKTWAPLAAQARGESKRKAATAAVETYVFSRTLQQADVPGATLVSENAGAFVRELKNRPGKGICLMGGGELARSLFQADVIDEVGMNVHPVLLGRGVPMFLDAGGRVRLRLTECRSIEGGCVVMNYSVVHGDA